MKPLGAGTEAGTQQAGLDMGRGGADGAPVCRGKRLGRAGNTQLAGETKRLSDVAFL